MNSFTGSSMPQKKHPLTVEDLWSIKRVGSPTLSADGRFACASVTAFDMDKNEGRTELWLYPMDGGKARRLTAGDKDSEPHWSPDGRWIGRRCADLCHRAGRRRSAKTHRAWHGRIRSALVSGREAHRFRVLGVA
ncbi:MAG: hypothetical protein E6H67_17130 [Betaproteobacteria bacterium]|nr:MAG: hypothetical protein E6H67_17130 [Betaproteobacteria bacterium]